MNIQVINSKIFKDLLPGLGEVLKGNTADHCSPNGATVKFRKMTPGEPLDLNKKFAIEATVLFKDDSRRFYLKFWSYNILSDDEPTWTAHSGSGTVQDYKDILDTLAKIQSIISNNITKLKDNSCV